MKFGKPPTEEQPKAKTEIRILLDSEIQDAIDLYARSLPRHWPLNEAEARVWAEADFRYPETVGIGYFWNDKLIGVGALCVYEAIYRGIEEEERKMAEQAIQEKFSGANLEDEIVYFSCLAIDGHFEGMGIGNKLATKVMEMAKERNKTGIIARTARPNDRYPNLGGLACAIGVGFAELLEKEKGVLYYPQSRLQKVWLYKKLEN